MPTQAAGNLLTPPGRYLMRFQVGRDTPLLANHRADLQRVLLDQLPVDWVRTDAEVTGVQETGGRVARLAGPGEEATPPLPARKTQAMKELPCRSR